MKKYNSVFTIALSIDHDKEDASDITFYELLDALLTRLSDAMNHDPLDSLVTGPDDTIELKD